MTAKPSCYDCEKQIVCGTWRRVRTEIMQCGFFRAPTADEWGALSEHLANFCEQFKQTKEDV